MALEREQSEKKRLMKYAGAAALFWGIITYFYAFLNFTISHDSLVEFKLIEKHKIGLGRFMTAVYQRFVRGEIAVPWLAGVLSLIFLSLTVYVLARIIKTQSAAIIFLAAGMMITSPAVFTLAGTYIMDMDADVLGMLLSFLSVWAWRSEKRWLLIPGAFCISLSVGLYQSHLSIAVALIIVLSILDLADSQSAKKVFFHGIDAIVMIVVGVIAYMIMVKVMCRITNTELMRNGYNSVTNVFSQETYANLPANILKAYEDFKRTLLFHHFGHANKINVAACIVHGGALCALAYRSMKNRISAASALLMAVLLGLLPVGTYLSMLANKGQMHDLMKSGMISVSMLAVFAVCPLRKENAPVRWCALLVMGCMAFVSWQYVVDANQLFLKQDINRQTTISIMTRVTEDIEEHAEYVRGETPVLFVGDLSQQMQPFSMIPMMESPYTGSYNLAQISYDGVYPIYYQYILQLPIRVCDNQRKAELLADERVKLMPIYPQKGSIQMMDDTLVVKLIQ